MEIPLQSPPFCGEKQRFGRYNLPSLHAVNVYNQPITLPPFHEENISPQGSPCEEEACVTDADLGFFIGDRYFFHGEFSRVPGTWAHKPIVLNGVKPL